jgi:haloacetate dehalogenase
MSTNQQGALMFDGFERRRINCGEVEVNCVVGGNGPPVLLLHGFPQNLAMWARVAPLLARDFTVVAADLRGYGDTGKPPCAPDRSTYSFRTMAADQVRLMENLGHSTFHLVGHDRGGRTGHRMALDHPEKVRSLAVLDIVPTHAMFTRTNRHVAGAYWHWYFLSTPAPFAETMIGHDPDTFYETCLTGWGASDITSFDTEMLAEYRRCWRLPEAIHGSCSDYRAAATIDLEHDEADIDNKVACPALAFWGSRGVMHELFDMEAEWQERCADLQVASLPGGHFFVDQFPEQTATVLKVFLDRV